MKRVVSNNQLSGKYWFKLKHGLGPGTLPRDVEILDHVEDGMVDFVCLNRFLTTSELNEYDVVEQAPPQLIQDSKKLETNYAADMSNCFGAKDFGGTFDVEPDMFFTREEINEFGSEVADELTDEFDGVADIRLSDCYMESSSHLFCDFVVFMEDDEMEVESDVNIDFRRIKKPADIMRYKEAIKDQVRGDIDRFIDIHMEVN